MIASMAEAGQRIDKWLFFARVVKSRTLAQKLVLSGAVRVNREKTDNPARQIRAGDTLTIRLRGSVRVLKLLDKGSRRGPASEAATLYEDLSEPSEPSRQKGSPGGPADAPGFAPPERPPSKKERRALEKMRRGED